jgi:hypothetical protein
MLNIIRNRRKKQAAAREFYKKTVNNAGEPFILSRCREESVNRGVRPSPQGGVHRQLAARIDRHAGGHGGRGRHHFRDIGDKWLNEMNPLRGFAKYPPDMQYGRAV